MDESASYSHPPLKAPDLRQFEVVCRVRPLQESQTPTDMVVNEEKSSIIITSQVKNLSKEFTFHKIYKDDTSQTNFTQTITDQIFRTAKTSGKGSLILSYGVTNSGKTYTILGTEQEPGLLPNIIGRILKEFPEEKIKITALQAYNDQFYSLKDKTKLVPSEYHGVYQFDTYQPQIATVQSIKLMIKQYMINRSQTDTKTNRKSSRSHAIFKIVCDEISVAIVDLAGSERLNKANSNIQQTSSINSSLLVLGKCIHAFRDRGVVPFRESKLTKALTEYFNEQYKIYMIAHINRSGEMFHENVNVLEYAAITTMVKHLNAQVNQSIVKNFKRTKSKSCIKNKQQSPEKENTSQQKSIQLKKGVKMKQDLEKVTEDLQKKRKRQKGMERYINKIIGRMEQFDFYLDRQFEILDKKDNDFIEQMRNTHYVSPSKTMEIRASVVKAQSRIKMRKEILQQIEREKRKKGIDVETDMGPSMKKCLQESIRRQKTDDSNEKQVEPVTLTPSKIKNPESILEQAINQSNKIAFFAASVKKIIGNVVDFVKSHSKRKSRKSNQQAKIKKDILSLSNQQYNVILEGRKPRGKGMKFKKPQRQLSPLQTRSQRLQLIKKLKVDSTNV